jgi:hypothetical protein
MNFAETLKVGLCLAAMVVFFMFVFATIWRVDIPHWLPGNSAYLLVAFCFVYYLIRGYLITAMYVWVKRYFPADKARCAFSTEIHTRG